MTRDFKLFKRDLLGIIKYNDYLTSCLILKSFIFPERITYLCDASHFDPFYVNKEALPGIVCSFSEEKKLFDKHSFKGRPG
jgi:hypothetical protein